MSQPHHSLTQQMTHKAYALDPFDLRPLRSALLDPLTPSALRSAAAMVERVDRRVDPFPALQTSNSDLPARPLRPFDPSIVSLTPSTPSDLRPLRTFDLDPFDPC